MFWHEGNILTPLLRLPKSENVAVDNPKGEVQIFLGQVTIYIFLLMRLRAFLENSFLKFQKTAEVRIEVCNWKDRNNSSAVWPRSLLPSYIKIQVTNIHQHSLIHLVRSYYNNKLFSHRIVLRKLCIFMITLTQQMVKWRYIF